MKHANTEQHYSIGGSSPDGAWDADQVDSAIVLMAKLILAMMAETAFWKYGRASLFGIASRLMVVVAVYNLGFAPYIVAVAS